MVLQNMMRGVKDGAFGAWIKNFVNERFGEYGEIQHCEVDTANNRVLMRALLKGETQIVAAAIERYDIVEDDGERYLVLRRFSASREWLTIALNKYLGGKRYRVPSALSRFL